MTDVQTGGCLCGAIRYRVEPAGSGAGFCHCTSCMKSSGALATVWMGVPAANFTYTNGKPSTYKSSDNLERCFCPTCGGQTNFRTTSSERPFVGIAVATLDDPESVKPTYHIWTSESPSWFDTADDLPRKKHEWNS